jgi:hypothetical protein
MMDLIMDYVWNNKYLLLGLGILTLANIFQWYRHRKLVKRVYEFEVWGKEIYQYMSEISQRRG